MNDFTAFGYDPKTFGFPSNSELPARVIGVQKERFAIVSPLGEGHARLKASEFYANPRAVYPTIGDFVCILPNESGDSRITRTLPRKSFFARADAFGARGVQAVAANMDYVFIVSSLNRDFNLRRLERYLAQALESGAQPVIILTKADLCPDASPYINEARSIAKDIPVISLSAHTGLGLELLDPFLMPGKTLVLLGMSGVGKSSLLNALIGQERMKVDRTRNIDPSKGRHTTTHRELLCLPCGAMIIDTPGMRELGVWDARDGAAEVFSDIEALAARCRFSDCMHEREPGCAVQAALADGSLDRKRYRSYLDIIRQAKYTARLAARKRR